MLSEPTITVTCDRCRTYEEQIGLTSLAGGGYDDRNLSGALKRGGWRVDGEEHICEDCQAEEESAREAR